LLAIALFAVSTFVYSYSYQGSVDDQAALGLSLAYPYQGYALAFVGTGSFLMVTASVSYSKRSKNMLQ